MIRANKASLLLLLLNIRNVTKFALLFVHFIFLALVVYFNFSVYRKVRRNERQIIANQVSLEAKEKLYT